MTPEAVAAAPCSSHESTTLRAGASDHVAHTSPASSCSSAALPLRPPPLLWLYPSTLRRARCYLRRLDSLAAQSSRKLQCRRARRRASRPKTTEQQSQT
eukprot:1907527-Rhodomonas_salina.1